MQREEKNEHKDDNSSHLIFQEAVQGEQYSGQRKGRQDIMRIKRVRFVIEIKKQHAEGDNAE
ncbi:MAG: hypothetical protein IJ601_05000 [Acidaminococcaceae bacterium]|nr:hypothetical protein [Acidaminococcaceae bacterium]